MKGIKIKGFSNYWIFPELGMIWSNPRKDKLGREVCGGWIGKPNKTNGYWYVALIDDNGKKHHFSLHRLIWMSVYGEILEGMVINHLDEDRSNNAIWNLEVCTQKENINYGSRTERAAKKKSKLVGAFKENTLIVMFTSAESARKLCYNPSAIIQCCKGKRQTHKGYKWRYIN